MPPYPHGGILLQPQPNVQQAKAREEPPALLKSLQQPEHRPSPPPLGHRDAVVMPRSGACKRGPDTRASAELQPR
jgi:hypothetical protein